MDLYNENLDFLKTFSPQLYQVLVNLPEQHYSTTPSKSGPLTLSYHTGGQTFYIHSKYNPIAEAEKLLQKANLEADHIVLFGMGCGYHLEQLINRKNPKTRVLVVEPEMEVAKHALKALKWEPVFNRPDLFFAFGKNLNVLAETIEVFFDMVSFTKFETIELPAAVRFQKDYFSKAKARLDSEIKTLLYDFKTRMAEESMVPRNILKNIGGILETRRVNHLEDKFTGKPAFIVSAGPSLDKNILLLKKIKNRAVIICVDTALKPLLKRGIQPHFTVAADPSYKNYLHLQDTQSKLDYFLVTDTGIAARVYRDFQEHLFSVSLGKPLFKMIENNIGEIGEVDAWGSIISLALTFALYLGCNPIVFLGQDFAYTDMRNHCRGTSWEEKWLEGTNQLEELQRYEKRSIKGIAKMHEPPDVYGNKTLSSDRLILYKNYLVKTLTSTPQVRFINATEGGILTEIETKPLHNVLREFVYGQPEINFKELYKLPSIRTQDPKSRKKLNTFFKGKIAFFKKYRKKATEISNQLINLRGLPFQSAVAVLEEAENLKHHLYSNLQNGEIVEMWSQGPIYAYLRKSAKLEGQPVDEDNLDEFGQLFSEYFKKLTPLVTGIIKGFEDGLHALEMATHKIHTAQPAQPAQPAQHNR